MSTIKYPDDTKDKLHISSGYVSNTLQDIIEASQRHFGEDVDFEKLSIEAEHIQVSCFGHDLYDSSDYTNFIVITREA